MPDGFVIRTPSLADVDATIDLVNTCSLADRGTASTSRTDILRHWQDPHRMEDDEDTLVVAPDGRVVGYLEYYQYEPFIIFEYETHVHPEYRDLGIEAELFEIAEARARRNMHLAPAGERIALQVLVPGTAHDTHRLLIERGYQHVRDYRTMLIEMSSPPSPPVWPDGVTVRRFERDRDERALWEMSEAAWMDHWGYVPMPLHEFIYYRIEAQTNFDPSLWLLAVTPNDAIVGAMLGLPDHAGDTTIGWVSLLATQREYRGRGIGMALLKAAFIEFWSRDYRKVGLNVDGSSITGANRLYERAGMGELYRMNTFEKVLAP